MLSSFFCPKWLFIVVNVIVVYLVGESKLLGSPTYSCSSSAEIYEEYVERSKSFRRSSVSSRPQTTEQSKLELNLVENRPVFVDEKEEGILLPAEDKHQVPEEEQEEEEKEKDREVEEDCEEQEEKVGEEEIGLPADELNKRVEEFIARINKQRWLEEKLLVSCMA
ncbi:hypothetical protein K2173_006683 [Erythroxylum novogranatense]|uniref:DUF4408 domain-containing protein n=1 Tax=Erythroxylum novogranatense TaxID=1862640 RepID=A0AAV8SY28_9ROSI|nr:hypothetical protein K2173_006683 [Erythroxylum novogranatense]